MQLYASHPLFFFSTFFFFQDTFSKSLPQNEETAFEEKFKYLIVTSPLLNEILSVHKHKPQHALEFHSLPKTSKLGVTTNVMTTVAILFGIERYMMKPKLPLMTLAFSTSASLFFMYRHKVKHSQPMGKKKHN